MPTEDRRIIFSSEEVYKALYALASQKQVAKPPPGFVRGVQQDEADESKIYLVLENQGDGSEISVEYSRDFLAAALLLFCRGLGIPVAKSGKKAVLVKDGQVMLRITIG